MQKRQLFPELWPASPGRVALPRQIEDLKQFRYQVLEYGPDSLSAVIDNLFAKKIVINNDLRFPLSLRID